MENLALHPVWFSALSLCLSRTTPITFPGLVASLSSLQAL